MSGLGKIIGYRICACCGKEIPIRHKKRMEYKNVFCDKKCESKYKKELEDLNCECEICHKLFHRKPSAINKYEHNYCSIKCHALAKEKYMLGEHNHQYGLKGEKNPSWKSNERISTYGYRLIRCENHPFKNSDDYVFEHRLVAEQYLLDQNNSVVINEKRYLSSEYHVHHLDFNRLNNSVENLFVVEKHIHSKFHNLLNGYIRKTFDDKINAVEVFSVANLKELFWKYIIDDELKNDDFERAIKID